MNKKLININVLTELMKSNNKYVQFFNFVFNKVKFFVALDIIDYENTLNEYEYRLRFVNIDNNEMLDTIGNSFALQFKPNCMWEYFKVKINKNEFLNEINKLYEALNNSIPKNLNIENNDYFEKARNYYSNKDNDKYVFCYEIRNNPPGQTRTSKNDFKGQLYCKEVYAIVGKYKEVSFVFCDDPSKQRGAKEILENYRNNKR